MYKKICTRCLRNSYSSTRLEAWQCPYCLYDLTAVKGTNVDHSLNLSHLTSKLNRDRGRELYKLI